MAQMRSADPSSNVRYQGQPGRHLLALSFSQFDPTATLIITDTPRSGPNCRRAEGNVRRLQATCYFTSARKLGVGSAPMSACLDTVAAAPGVPAATPRIGGAWRVTCAVY
jgi:hypothetical protein